MDSAEHLSGGFQEPGGVLVRNRLHTVDGAVAGDAEFMEHTDLFVADEAGPGRGGDEGGGIR